MASQNLHEEAPIVARADGGGLPAPDGLHPAVCVDVVSLGLQPSAWGPKPRVRIVWQLELESPDTERRFVVHRTYTLSLGAKAALRRDLESWRGKAFSSEELAGFDLLKLLGVNCQLQTVLTIREGGGSYANVQAIVPAGRGTAKLQPVGYVREKDREKDRPASAIGGRR